MTLPLFCQALRLTAVFSALITAVCSAADVKRRFDLAAADATDALPRFADQANSEIVFAPALWPDFDRPAFERCLDAYATRDRRFGGRIG